MWRVFLAFFIGSILQANTIEKGIELFEKKRFKEAFRVLMPFAKKGEAEAEFFIGLIYDMGSIDLMDKEKAVIWYLKAAKKGYPRAQYDMGVMLSKGEGIKKDLKEALKWYQKSAKNGFGYAMYNLGVAYQRGYGTDIDLDLAKSWYKRALEHNISKAGFNLGSIYFKDNNFKEAFKFFKKAAELGNRKAMFYLAWMYENGAGVKKDLKEAKRLYKISAIKGSRKSAKRYIEILESEGDISEAKFWREAFGF